MRIVQTIKEMSQIAQELKEQRKTIGLVPTMGYLHAGHGALMTEAKKTTDVVVTSIFVNPIQFGIGEDYEEYPRDLAKDSQLAEQLGVDYIFAPTGGEMYPQGYLTFINTEKITEVMCGASRPGHFRGVTTVVAKLFNIVRPDKAFFGQKDAQQLIVIQKMVADLNIPVEIVAVPIVREEDGLAMSSRNVYLSDDERTQAVILFKALEKAREKIDQRQFSPEEIYDMIKETIETAPLAKIEYIQLRDGDTLEELAHEKAAKKVLIALAVRFGNTRLIDNTVVEV